jgi:hypothetical protein
MDDEVSTLLPQISPVARVINANHESKPTGASGSNTGSRIFKHGGPRRVHRQHLGRSDKHVRKRLTTQSRACCGVAIYLHINPSSQAGRSQNGRAITAGRDDCRAFTKRVEPLEQIDRPWKSMDLADGEALLKHLLLPCCNARKCQLPG